MLDGLAPLTHVFGVFVEPALDCLDNMLPAGDPALLAHERT
jgi:hypothetical protein